MIVITNLHLVTLAEQKDCLKTFHITESSRNILTPYQLQVPTIKFNHNITLIMLQYIQGYNKKKRVTAGEVDKLGKELGTTNDDKNKQALSTLSLLQVGEERQTTTEGIKKRRRGERRGEGYNKYKVSNQCAKQSYFEK